MDETNQDLLQVNLDALTETECRKLLTLYMTQKKLGLYWERNQIEHDKAVNTDAVFLRLAAENGEALSVGDAPYRNLIIEGDNFDALRCLRATHSNKIRVIYIDPPYNTGNKDWVYNDRYVNDAMIFPAEIPLSSSPKNIYGYYPPSKDMMANVEQVMLIDERRFLSDKVYQLADNSAYSIGYFDYTYALNNEELIFTKALDASEFVIWWHRNPDRKPYSTAIVRADKANYFYPDFVLCVRYYPDAEPRTRLVETKADTKDAMNKAGRPSVSYGKVIFLTRNNQKLHIVNDNGSLGKTVGDNLIELRERLRETDNQTNWF